jgi:cytochrome P450
MNEQIGKVKQDLQAGFKKNEELKATIFHEILTGSLPEKEKSTKRLAAEGQTMISAGTETTAWTLATITAYLLVQPTTLCKLQAEFSPIIPDGTHIPSWSNLEKLVFFNAVILEGIRLTYGVAARQPRAAPDEQLQLKSSKTGAYFHVPAGTPIGMTSVLVHHNPDIFPEPLLFKPERWINEQGGIRIDLQRYLLSFSKGSRQCLGMQYVTFLHNTLLSLNVLLLTVHNLDLPMQSFILRLRRFCVGLLAV